MGHSRATLTARLAVVVLSLSACGSASVAAPTTAPLSNYGAGTTMARISAAGRMKVGIRYDQPGFGLKAMDGTFSGLDVEMAKILAGAMGLTADNIDWVESPATARETQIENGVVDLVVATFPINDASRVRVTFAGPYFIAGKSSYGIGITKGDVKFCEFINATLKNNSAAYAKALAETAGQAGGAAPAALPPATACI